MSAGSDRPARVRALFDAVLELDGAARAARLAASGESAEVLDEVRALLESSAVREHALDRFSARGLLSEEAQERPMPHEAVPQRIGAYRVLRLLGEGGMSRVYEAERESLAGRVAIKVLRRAQLAPQAAARFERELEILSNLDHPRIVRVLDAGWTGAANASERYLVLERIEGSTLDAYVREHRLDLGRRLRLFLAICEGVAHAHARGVIHRDLKPSNVLVDVVGEPHLLDFGVARLVEEPGAHTELRTRAGQVVGTLEYMSPEQASGRSDAIDTRSDVYALGVLLYELASSTLPYQFEGRSFLDCVRQIAEEEPRPLGSVDRNLRGDLETIAAKALRREPEQRYATVVELAHDVERFLAHEAISARRPSTVYQLQKFARRHPGWATGLAVGLIALLAGGAAVSVAWLEAREQRALASEQLNQTRVALEQLGREKDRADQEARAAERARAETASALEEVSEALRVSQQVGGLLNELLTGVQPYEQGRDVLLRDLLRRFAPRLGDDSDLPAGVRGPLRASIASSLSSLGEASEALALYERAIEDFAQLGPEAELQLLHARHARTRCLDALSRYPEARAELEQLHAQALESQGPDAWVRLNVLHSLALVEQVQSELGSAEAHLRECVERTARLLGEDNVEVVSMRASLGGVLLEAGRWDEAEELLVPTLARLREDFPERVLSIQRVLGNLAFVSFARGDYGRAVELRREELRQSETHYGPRHATTMQVRLNLASILSGTGDPAELERVFAGVTEWARGEFGDTHSQTAQCWMIEADLAARRGRLTEAMQHAQEARRVFAQLHGERSRPALTAALKHAFLSHGLGDPTRTRALLEGLLEPMTVSLPPGDDLRLQVLEQLGRIHIELGQVENALPPLEEALRLRESTLGLAHPWSAESGLRLLEAYESAGQFERCFALGARLETVFVAADAPALPAYLGNLHAVLGRAHVLLGEFDEARERYLAASLIFAPEGAAPDANLHAQVEGELAWL